MTSLLKEFMERLADKREVTDLFDQVVKEVPVSHICSRLSSAVSEHSMEVLCNVLRQKKNRKAIGPLLHLLRRTRYPKVRAAAAETLGDLHATVAGPTLLRLLKDKGQPVYVRDTVAVALGLVHYRKAIPTLKTSSLKSHCRTIRECSTKALAILSRERKRQKPGKTKRPQTKKA